MSFYIRKSLRSGPFRFNLSKSGIGVSVGFTGFRIGTGPRGNYVHMGRNGLYYKASLPCGNKPSTSVDPSPSIPTQPPDSQISSVNMKDIESVDVLQLQDSSASDLLDEINNKHKKLQLWPFAAILSVVVLIIMIALESQAWGYAVAIPIAVIGILLTRRQDQLKKTVILFYELDSDAEGAFQCLHDAFKELITCTQAWHIASSGNVNDLNEQKRQAGASALVRRNPIHITLQPPAYVSTNLSIPAIPVGRQVLYFFPDRLLVIENGKVGAVPYSEIQLDLANSRFIESQSVPHDAQIVDQTWQYVNKKGGPDKRFKTNRQLPIALYSELFFKSSNGLNELIQLSKPNIGLTLVNALKRLASAQQEVTSPNL